MLKTASSSSESVLSLVLKVLGKFLPHNQILNFRLTRLQVWTKLEASENSEDISVLFFNFRFLPNPGPEPDQLGETCMFTIEKFAYTHAY